MSPTISNSQSSSNPDYSPLTFSGPGSTDIQAVTQVDSSGNEYTTGQKTSAGSSSIVPASDSPDFPVAVAPSTTATQSSVSGSATSVTILASNSLRKGCSVANDSASTLYLRCSSSAASTTSYTVKLVTDAYWESPFNYTGAITGIWASATGAARITEYT